MLFMSIIFIQCLFKRKKVLLNMGYNNDEDLT